MCCTTIIVERKSAGICDKTNCNAFGPPVEIPIAMTRRGGNAARVPFFSAGKSSIIAGGSLRPAARFDFYFCNQLVGDFIEVAGGGVLGLGEKIDGAQRESLERGVATLFRMSAEENDRERSAPHDEAQRFHAIHAGHVQVQGDHIRLQLFNFFQRKCAVHSGANNFYRRFARQDRGDQFPHESGIIDDENSDTVAHAIAPRGFARASRERTAGTFKIRTTVPSPRMEAPLTKSLETISVGSALITSSSSPTRLSTMRPKRFSAAPMTMTKCFFRTG